MGGVCDKATLIAISKTDQSSRKEIQKKCFKLSDDEKTLIRSNWQRITVHYIDVGVLAFTR